jgi:DNA-directed RNA polymerase specialized sigma24 family protein
LPTEEVAVDQESHAFPAPEHQIAIAEERAVLWSAVQTLPDKHHDLMEMLLASPTPSYADISHSLDMAVGSIGPTRMRAIENLRSCPQIAALAS